MDIKKLRPRDNSSAAIRDALAVIADERHAAEQRQTEATATRKALLLTGTPKQLQDADTAARNAALDIEQLDALAESLRPELKAARDAEAIEALREQSAAAEQAIERFRAFLHNEYPALAVKLAAGLKLEQAARAAVGGFHAAKGELQRREVDLPYIPNPTVPHAYGPQGAVSLADTVRLPAAAPGPAPWMPETAARLSEGQVYAARDPENWICFNPLPRVAA